MPDHAITLVGRQFWKVQLAHRPSIDELIELIAVPGLSDDWKRRLGEG